MAARDNRREPRPRGRPPHPDVLTPTEWAVLLKVREGLGNAEIAQIRGCRVDTVKYHVANIVGKLQLTDRAALRRWSGRPLGDEPRPGIDLARAERRQKMATTTAPGTLTGIAPMFLVDDVARTAEWYRDHLGFQIGDYLREDHAHGRMHESLGEPVFAILHRDGQRVMLGRTTERGSGVHSNQEFKKISCDAYFWVEDVEALYAYAKAARVTFLQDLHDRYYGLREFQLRDCDGRVLTFGGDLPGS
ncbi:LuxR C-terminal-related transcriptional regulator [Actinopolymorpha sp. B11F2]|uniref:LuxR C-terminal-related transcriptional regulator n=1 Tax=Actinopolymorpha sp. B11F2 TaxID=3160862 RepID=UPI0032E37D12